MTATIEERLQLSGFSPDQIQEIQEGIRENLDITYYANKNYMSIQMHQIRLGLKEGLSVEYYAKPYYDWFQMEEIRKGLRAGLDVTAYSSPYISYNKMRQLRKGLQAGINLVPYQHLDVGVLRELRKSILSGVSILPYIKENYTTEQLRAIRHALEKQIDIAPYLDISLRGSSIREIRLGLEHGLEVEIYARPEYSWRKMREIRLGLEHRIDVTQYADSFYSCWQMKEIRLGLEENLDVSKYNSLMYTAREMNRLRLLQQTKQSESVSNHRLLLEQSDAMNILISMDEINAYIEITCKAETLSAASILKALHNTGISYGIDETTIRNLVSSTYDSPAIPVAKGIAPITGKNGWYEFFTKENKQLMPQELPDGSVDFQSIEWFEPVKAGQIIAIYHPPEEGVAGMTVTGKTIPAKRGLEEAILTGSGFQLLPDRHTYIAAIDGILHCQNHHLNVTKLLTLQDITNVTGDVLYDGSIHVTGHIGSEVTLRARGDIIVDGYVESANIECGGSIFFRQGVHGSGTGTIKAKKHIIGKFFESVTLSAGKNIQAVYYLNCNLSAKGEIITLGAKGSIVGGSAYAENGFFLQTAGNASGLPTELYAGTTPALRKNLHQFEAKYHEISKELEILCNVQSNLQKKYSPEHRNTMDIYLKIENAIYTKRLQLQTFEKEKSFLHTRIEKANSAKVVVKRTLYEHVTVDFGGVIWHSGPTPVSHIEIRKKGTAITATPIQA